MTKLFAEVVKYEKNVFQATFTLVLKRKVKYQRMQTQKLLQMQPPEVFCHKKTPFILKVGTSSNERQRAVTACNEQ